MSKDKYLRAYIRKEIKAVLEVTDPKVKAAKIKKAQASIDAAKAEMLAAQDELKAAQAVKESELSLLSILEAEEGEDKGGEEEGGNPFAAAGGEEEGAAEEGGEEGGEEGAEEGGEEGGEETSDKKTDKDSDDGLTVTFDVSKVKRYNNQKFRGNTGVVKKISKDGLVVTTQPDNVDILINFDDITESAKRFFKKRK